MLSSGMLVALPLAGMVGLVFLRGSGRAVCQADASGRKWCMSHVWGGAPRRSSPSSLHRCSCSQRVDLQILCCIMV